MKVLGLDSATRACSAAVSDSGDIRARQFEMMTRGQSETLLPIIENVLARAGLASGDLDLIAVTVGPGAFTGLRIAIATAIGLSLASGVRAVGISTLEAIAYGAGLDHRQSGPVVVALDSRRDDIYVQAFSEPGSALAEAEAIQSVNIPRWLSELKFQDPVLLAGDACERIMKAPCADAIEFVPVESPNAPDAAHVAALATVKQAAGIAMHGMKPLYLRPPDATIPKNGGRLRA